MSVLKRQLAIHTQDDPKQHLSVMSSGSKQSTRASAMKQSPSTILDLNRSPALHKPLPSIPLHQAVSLQKNNSLEDLSTQRSNAPSKG